MEQHRHHPVMKALRCYLRDCAEAIALAHTQRWATGQMLPAKDEDRLAIHAQLMNELESLEYRHIAEFYGLPQSNGDDT